MKTKEKPSLKQIRIITDGDLKFEQQLIQVLKKELPEEIEYYKKNVADKMHTEAAEAVHKLKHKISLLGLEEGYKLAASHEDNLKNANEDLKNDFETILDEMTLFCNQI